MEISTSQIRIGYRLGVYDYDDVQAWVDFHINQTDEPSDELLNLSFANRNEKHVIYSLLSVMPFSTENDESLIRVLSDLKENDVNNINYCRELAKRLYAYYGDRNYEVDETLNEIAFLDDGYDLALMGIGDTVESWHVRFKEFIHVLRNC